jgi:pimeloyl-ACP methyl ester carboxylesterase
MPYATVNGVTLHYREAGEGPAALFLHGFPFDHTMWLDQMGGLAHLRRCIAMDLRGFGRSGRRYLEPLTMERHADDAAALVGSLGEQQVDVIAMSMGGYVALAMWERHPEVIRSLTLIDTKAGADSEEGQANRDHAAEHLVASGKDAWGGDLIQALVAPDATVATRGRLRSMIGRTSYDTIISALAGMRDRPDRSGVLPTITVPTSVVVGELDRLTPPEVAAEMAAAIPGAPCVVIPDAGHVAPLENAAAVNGALAGFLQSVDDGTATG